jgi:DNA-binding IclR family transcriptional regulator
MVRPGSVNAAAAPRSGIQSVELAVPLLKALANAREPLQLVQLALATGMPRSKAHKYLASLVRSGLAAQDEAGGRYKLGPFALELGLAAMRGVDVLDQAQATLNRLRDDLNITASLAVWTSLGPSMVRWAQSPYITDALRLGTVFPLLTSTFGRVFAAYLDRRYTGDLIRAELVRGAAREAGISTMKQVNKLLADVRRTGLAIAHSVVAPGVDAISAPVFDHTGGIVASIALAGLQGRLDTSPAGRPASSLAAAAADLSAMLGARG